MPENTANGTTVYTIGSTDDDGPGATYTILGGNTGGAFVIVGNAIQVANSAALDYETVDSSPGLRSQPGTSVRNMTL